MKNPNAPLLSQQEYAKNIRKRFEEFNSKTDTEIADTLRANDDRSNYDKEFALDDQEVGIEDKMISFDRLQVEFPTIGDWLTKLLKDGGNGSLILMQFENTTPKKGRDKVIWPPQNIEDLKSYSQENISFERQNTNQFYLAVNIEPSADKDDFGRPTFIMSPVMFERPALTKYIPNYTIYSKSLSEEEFRELKQKHSPSKS